MSLEFFGANGVGLALSEGTSWGIAAVGRAAAPVMAELTTVMQLKALPALPSRLLLLHEEEGLESGGMPGYTPDSVPEPVRPAISGSVESTGKVVLCPIRPKAYDMRTHLMRACRAISWHTELEGGLLLHAALADRQGHGIVMAGPSGAGKSTASSRLPLPWNSLCDDLVLLIRDRHLSYRAHPWPTWSNFMEHKGRLSWDAGRSVPLTAIFFLCQSPFERVDPVGAGHAACLLVESTEQTWLGVDPQKCAGEVQALRRCRFAAISDLVRSVPCSVLHLSLYGEFWREIERKIHEVAP